MTVLAMLFYLSVSVDYKELQFANVTSVGAVILMGRHPFFLTLVRTTTLIYSSKHTCLLLGGC